jgi:hypothetical protein
MHQHLKSLDELIADLAGPDAGERSMGALGLLSEHLQAARRNLLGAMPGEYRMSLREAKDSLSCIPKGDARSVIRNSLQSLIDSSMHLAGGHARS